MNVGRGLIAPKLLRFERAVWLPGDPYLPPASTFTSRYRYSVPS